MDTVSFFVRTFLWLAACILLAWSIFVDPGVLTFLVFFLVVLLAWGYSWLDNVTFGQIVRHEPEPDSTVKEVYADVYLHRAHLNTRYQTRYHKETPAALIRVLEDLLQNDTHVGLIYGDVSTGRVQRSVAGYVHRSTGARQIPLLAPRSEQGGSPIKDHCILRILDLDRDFVLYQHPSFHEFEEEHADSEASS